MKPHSPLSRGRLAAGVTAGAVLLASVAGAPIASAHEDATPPPSGAAQAGPPDREVKPFSPGSVEIDAAALEDGADSVRVVTDPQSGFVDASVSVAANGADVSAPSSPASVGPSSTATRFEVDVDEQGSAGSVDALAREAVAPDAMSTLSATMSTLDSSGQTHAASDQVWVANFDGVTLVSDTGEQDLRLRKVEHLETTGKVDAGRAEALRETILGATGAQVTMASANACTGVCISGTVQWTDSAGGKHPVPFAPVQIRDDEQPPTGTPSELVTTVTTALDGTYSASVDNNDGAGQGNRDVFVRVLAAGEDFNVGNQHIQSPVTHEVPTGTELTVNLTANNTTDNNTAFSLQNAMYLGTKYLDTRVPGGLRFLDVVYPDPDGSFYDRDKLHVLSLDRFDWDVMLHEYGHFVANELDIENNPGGSHSSEDNLSVSRGSKAIGVPLAFGEGWPTYFAVSLLQIMGAAALNVPNAGDTLYQDTEDQIVTDNLETGGTLGEDNEYTVMSVLWDLYDTPADGLDNVALGDQVVWDRLIAGGTNDPGTLSDAYRLLAVGGVGAADPVSCVFSGQNVAPKLATPPVSSVSTLDPAPTFTWTRGNGGTFQNNQFVLELRDSTGDNLLFASPPQAGLSYTPSNATWVSALNQANGTLRVAVVGTQTAAPVTGPYRSCMRNIAVTAPGTDVVFSSDRDGNAELYVMKSDGSDQTRLTNDAATDRYPAWSPDGQSIAWTRDSDLWVMDANGANPFNRTGAIDDAVSQPAWTSDGSQLLFVRNVAGHDELWRMNADGTGVAAVVSHADTAKEASAPAVSASNVVFFSLGGDLYRVNPSGTGLAPVLESAAVDQVPDVGNLGKRMAFSRSSDGSAPLDVVTSRLDGTDKKNLTATAAGGAALDDLHASFSPDDTRLVFVSKLGGDEEVHRIGADGAGDVALTDNAAADIDPDWRTAVAPTPAFPCLANPPAAPHEFGDVPGAAYYNDAVSWLVASSITTGVSPGVYGPNQAVTRGQMAAFLWRTVCTPGPAQIHAFGDVSAKAYYHDAASWLADAGVTNGTGSGKFSPNQKVTRGQMAAFLWRLAGSPAPAQAHTFGDVSPGAYYNDAVSWLVEAKITTGVSPGTFAPNAVVHRSELAAFLDRYAN
ncbi:MAG: S-layer homology domain-containing protein [Microthrixaceae bacterium]